MDVESTQLSWLFNEAEVIADHEDDDSDHDNGKPGTGHKKGTPHKRSKSGRRKRPDHFPRIEVVHVLDDDDCHCDHCQGKLKEMGQKTSEQIELIPLTVKVIKHIKKTYSCPNCNQ